MYCIDYYMCYEYMYIISYEYNMNLYNIRNK